MKNKVLDYTLKLVGVKFFIFTQKFSIYTLFQYHFCIVRNNTI